VFEQQEGNKKGPKRAAALEEMTKASQAIQVWRPVHNVL
jgi:hypothetical protein